MMKKKWLALGLAAVMSVAMAVQPMTVRALERDGEIWDDLCGESTINSTVINADGTRLWTSIQTNYHAGGITGLIVETPRTEVNRIMGISEQQWWEGLHATLYVAQASQSTAADVELMQQYAATLGGKAWYDYELLMFYTGTKYEQVAQTSEPIRMVVGISEREREHGYAFAMLHLKDGVGEFYYDLDTDHTTMTFETSDFTGVYVLVKYPGVNKPADTTTKGQATNNGQTTNDATAGELDEVPKMGDHQVVMPAVIFAGSMLIGVAAFVYRRKLSANS